MSGKISASTAFVFTEPEHRDAAEQQPEQVRSAVAHVDRRRVEVVDQEAERRARRQRGEHPGRRCAAGRRRSPRAPRRSARRRRPRGRRRRRTGSRRSSPRRARAPSAVRPGPPKSTAPTNGIVTLSTLTPACTAIEAATIWPASFQAADSSKRSSIAPTTVITAAASEDPVQDLAARQHRDGRDRAAREDRQPAEQRRPARRQAAPARAIDRPDRAGRSASSAGSGRRSPRGRSRMPPARRARRARQRLYVPERPSLSPLR